MSRQFRNRLTSVTVVAMIAVAPLLATENAHAEQAEGAPQVVFGGGGVLGLSCASRPNVSTMRVPAESTVRVVNDTGFGAELRLDGALHGRVPNNGGTSVVFRRGTVTVTLEPDCVLGDDSRPVRVTAEPQPSTPDPSPPPSEPRPVDPPVDSAPPTTGGAVDHGPSMPDSPPAVGPSSRGAPASGVSRPDMSRPDLPRGSGSESPVPRPGAAVEDPAAPSMPPGGAAAGRAGGAADSTATAPTFAGMPPGDRVVVVPGSPTVEAFVAGVQPTVVAAAEPVATIEPLADRGPRGLLVAVAAVCLMGVAVAALQVISTQRANRAKVV